jgi:large subunit ribosomal protein L17
MRHHIAGRKLNRPTAHRNLMLRTMVTDFIRHETVQTTQSKAKEVRKMAEKVITLGKKGTLHHRRQAAALLTDEKIVKKLFDDLGGRYQSRNGGYTRLTKIGTRKGDASEMAILELLD